RSSVGERPYQVTAALRTGCEDADPIDGISRRPGEGHRDWFFGTVASFADGYGRRNCRRSSRLKTPDCACGRPLRVDFVDSPVVSRLRQEGPRRITERTLGNLELSASKAGRSSEINLVRRRVGSCCPAQGGSQAGSGRVGGRRRPSGWVRSGGY